MTQFVNLSLLSLLLIVAISGYARSEDDWINTPVNLSFQNTTLHSVLDQIHDQTGISILIDESLANSLVTGAYQTGAINAIERLFRDMNIILQVSDLNKTIVVRTFGTQQYLMVGQSNLIETLADLDILHANQQDEIMRRLSDESAMFTEGMTLGQLRDIHRQQEDEIRRRLADDSTPFTEDMTIGQLRDMHLKQLEEYERTREAGTVEIADNFTVADLRDLHRQQQDDIRRGMSDGKKEAVPGMTRNELRALHAAQEKEIRNRLNDRSRPIAQ